MAQETQIPTGNPPRDGPASSSLMSSIPGVNQVTSFFQGNPMATPVGQLVERATDATLPAENWALNLEVCDMVNETDEGPKDAVRAIRKRLQLGVGNRNFTVVVYTLTVLETCVKNCGRRFHAQVAQKDFLKDLVNIMNPKHESPIVVQDKILTLIQCWSIAFQGAPELRAVEQTYQDLKGRGIVFPTTDLEGSVPIITPKRSSAPQASPANAATRPSPARLPSAEQPNPASNPAPSADPRRPNIQQIVQMSGPVAPTPEQMAKLRSELDIVNGNIGVMGDMLNEMVPGDEDPADLELLHELNRTCRAMQTRLLELIEKISVEEVIEELLHVNDDLNNVFLRFERFERYRTGKTAAAGVAAGESPVATAAAATSPTPRSPQREVDAAPLIDFSSPPPAANAEEDVQRQLSALGIGDAAVSVPAAAPTAAATAANGLKDKPDVKEDELKEMEAWLGATGGSGGGADVADSASGPISSSEFDDFLASRLQSSDAGGAAAAGSTAPRGIHDVPSIAASSGAATKAKIDDDQDLLLG